MGTIRERTDRSKRGKKAYEVRWYAVVNGRRKQLSKTFQKKTDAQNFQRVVEGDVTRGDFVDPQRGKMSFDAVADAWLEMLKVKAKTRVGYESILREHLRPTFGNHAVATIGPGDIKRFVASLDVQPGTKRNIIRVLSPIMNLAVLDGRIRVNPVSAYLATERLPRTVRSDDMPFLSAQQVQELAKEVGPKYRALILTAAYTGLRAGELAALRVKDLDLLHRRLRVRESVSDLNHKHTKECKPHFGTLHLVLPKNGKTRSLKLPGFLVDALAEQQVGKGREDFVFGGATPMRHANFYNRHFRPAVERLVESGQWHERFESFRFHDLRHSAASLLIGMGVQPKAIQERLGHSSITVTMDTYGHLYEGHDTEIADRLEEAYVASVKSAR